MKDFEKEKLKNKDYLKDYIKAETDNIGEDKLIDVISNILFQVIKLDIELLNYFNNNFEKLTVDKTKKRSNESKIDFTNSNSLYVLFTNIQNKIFDKPQVSDFLGENEELLKSIWTEDRVNLRITIFNIMLLIISFKKNQLDKKQNNQIKQPKVSNLGDIQNHGDQWDTVDKPPSLQKRNHSEPNTSEISDSDYQSITTEDGDSMNKKNNQIGITSPPISLSSKVNVLDHKLPSPNQTETGSTDDSPVSAVYPNAGSMGWGQIGFGFIVLLLILGFVWYNTSSIKSFVQKNSDNIIKQLGQIYTPPTEDSKDYGYLKTQFDKLSKVEVSPPKIKDSSLPKTTDPIPPVTTESNKGTLSLDEIAPTLKANLDDLDKKIKALKQISEKVEVKLDDAKIKEVFNSIVKDDNSDFGKMIKKINGIGDKKAVDTVDTTSAKDKKEYASLKSEIDKLNKSIGERDKEISKEKTSVTILNGEVDKKNKEIDKLETKLKSIGDEKTGFKGLTGNFAILFTNSKDFPLNQSILSTAFTLIEKQPKDQKFGVYIATGNQIAANLDLRDKKEKSLNLISPTGSPTEMLSDAGQAFLDYAFDGKNPIPIPDRKAIIIATWSAEAPKFNSSGWKDISQVDAILIQPANVQQIRYAKSWLDFVNQKNGRLLLISGPDNFDAGSDNLKQLSKQISTLLNTKKD
jgi:hypothetical protein